MYKCLCQHSSGSGTVACNVVGLGCNFLNQLCAHVLKRIVQLDVLCNGDTVIGDQRSAELLCQNNIAALGTHSNLNGVGQLVDTIHQRLACFFAKLNLLRHNSITPYNIKQIIKWNTLTQQQPEYHPDGQRSGLRRQS